MDGKPVNAGYNPRPDRTDDMIISRRTGLGTSAKYLTARIKRDFPAVFERMKAGEFKSVRAAAIEAGIVKPETPETKLRKAAARAPEGQEPSFCGDLDILVETHRQRCQTPWCVIVEVLEHKLEWARGQH